MRILVLAMLGIAIISAGKAQAQTYDPRFPVCMHLTLWGGSVEECTYYTIAQCQASASGRPGQCNINPFYAGATESSGRMQQRSRRAY